jgi:O-antigen ligase
MLLFGGVTLFSLMRTSYLALVIFFGFAVLKAPGIKMLRRYATCFFVSLPLLVFAGAWAQLEEYRPTETVWTLSDRVGLWSYLLDAMWSKSRWLGLGYFSASRIYGPEFNEGLGTAHSVFVEVLTGGGITAFVPFLVIWIWLVFVAVQTARGKMERSSFVAVSLLLTITPLLIVGSELEADPAGFTFWIIVAVLPILQQHCSTPKSVGQQLSLQVNTSPTY